jgi:hypothetical protein
VSSYYYMCPHTTICFLILLHVSSYYYMCPHATIYVSSYYVSLCYHICVLILLYVSSYYYIRVFILLNMCAHNTIYRVEHLECGSELQAALTRAMLRVLLWRENKPFWREKLLLRQLREEAFREAHFDAHPLILAAHVPVL